MKKDDEKKNLKDSRLSFLRRMSLKKIWKSCPIIHKLKTLNNEILRKASSNLKYIQADGDDDTDQELKDELEYLTKYK
jgi:hypothetical protein